MIRLKRVYEGARDEDGMRVLIDRLWPRGLSKEKAGVELWLKEVAPTDELRRWFGHEPERWPEFKARYREELSAARPHLERLKALERERGTLTLLYAARDEQHNNAVVLKEALAEL